MNRKLYSGHTLRQIRSDFGLSQTEFAKKIGLSTAYVNQIENNNRPVTASVLLTINRIFGIDLAAFEKNDLDRVVQDLEEVFADTQFHSSTVSRQEIQELVTRAPGVTQTIMDLYGALRSYHDRDVLEDDLVQMSGADEAGVGVRKSAYDEVRDFFHYTDNYVDSLDRAAEKLSHEISLDNCQSKFDMLTGWLRKRFDIGVEQVQDYQGTLIRHQDYTRKISIYRAIPQSTKNFLLGTVIAELCVKDLISEEVRRANFRTGSAESIATLALRNYFSGALLLPYDDFLRTATKCRHDIQLLSNTMDASIETVCHRLSTLQRQGANGLPFYFVKIDRAGNVVKRHSATRFQFARFGGSCPRWNVHQAFEQNSNKFTAQIAQMPDGVEYLCIATSVTKHQPDYGTGERRYALGIGCEVKYSDAIVYADRLAVDETSLPEPIGVNCRICPRDDCDQRAFPAIDKEPFIDPGQRGIVPYRVKAAG
ncbi:MAG: short-chain fatty acyl-CoA regulator family protein [Roseibium album]|uniref:Transcriptional regulator, y4mF family n=1 Tax=Roseibium album TaxID=311410 RepID=A0A0M7ARI9_9HYPH|nr:helix-turn-helix transcriptional regulator [Roseibium album]MBG6146438.1 putative transcriptional regulator/transcriptional regulator with XRE-family HTH domain [Labrenzia sp. EL_142]MBG6156564.1 putative transcriptional regulator/transcriptional regulator with XRE-family HTH domain [Labrenzia sp. EL_162]MBG6195496.1 putative transcriptional regulator/transcriptional regulator with XRE-family HTH domain [Labrenzia sp. EL_159]CTQ59962.1 transcriptional regulator, y4mF family [Roseibium album]